MRANPLISVVLPTFNRVATMREALASLQAQDYPRFEILVVDNDSSDDTAAAVQAACAADSRVRYLHEPEPGVCPARNLGCMQAQGEFVALADDDEVAPPQWLSLLAAAQAETGASGVGGPYTPLWDVTPPRWLVASRCLQETLSFMDFGCGRCPAEWLLGGNALYTRGALASVNYFGLRAGRIGSTSLKGASDIEIGRRLCRAGHALYFEPSAAVYHHVPAERMRLSYILRRAFWAGYNDVAIGREWQLGSKVARATSRGWDAMALGLVILPGVLWGRLMVHLGYLQPQNE
ncbi:MAG: glycosyltransferase [Armatimonadia bacterium]